MWPISAVLILAACDTNARQAPSAPTPVVRTQEAATPTAPTTATPLVTALRIDGVPASLSVGQSVRLAASLTLSDGTETLATDATWESSDTAVATVASGVLRVTGSGSVDISARASQHDASVHVLVPFAPSPDVSSVPDVTSSQTFGGSICAVNRPEWLPASTPTCSTRDPVHARFWFPANAGVPVIVNAQFINHGDYYPESVHFTVSCGTTKLWDRVLSGADTVENQGVIHSGPVAITVSQPCSVQVDAFDYVSAFKGTNGPTQYRVDIAHHR